jgi:ADP-L-glycero-D-manno-heptose 6-epimerase
MESKVYIVTGAAGFIGARLSRYLADRHPEARFLWVDKLSHFENRKEIAEILAPVEARAEKIHRDQFLSQLSLDPAFQKVSGIFHMGACSDTTQSDWEYLERVNVDYTKTLWRFCSDHQIPFVYASSAATYGGGEHGFADDESKTPLYEPLNLYGKSKQDFDLWALEEEAKGNHPPAWSGFKFFNVYGPGESHKGRMASVFLHAAHQIRTTGEMKLFKSHREGIAHGDQRRDFVFIDDVVAVLDFAMQKPIRRGIFNLGTGVARSFLDLGKAVFRALKKPENIQFIDMPEDIREKYQYFTEATMKRIRAEGYTHPFLTLEEGAEKYFGA